jgi:predicted acetyltransferase
MAVRIIDECDIAPELDAAIRKSLAICFPHRYEEFSRSRTIRNNVPSYTAVISDGEKALCQVAVMDRTISVGGEQPHVAGVANVFVMPEHRGKGLCDMALEAAMAEAKNRGFDFGFLFTYSPTDRIYARNGWFEIKDRKFVCVENGEESVLSAERIKMYYPLENEDFPSGDVHLQGDRW